MMRPCGEERERKQALRRVVVSEWVGTGFARHTAEPPTRICRQQASPKGSSVPRQPDAQQETIGVPGRERGAETRGARPRNRKPEAPIVFPNLPLSKGEAVSGEDPQRRWEVSAVGASSLATPRSGWGGDARRPGRGLVGTGLLGENPRRTRSAMSGPLVRRGVQRDVPSVRGQRPTSERPLLNGSQGSGACAFVKVGANGGRETRGDGRRVHFQAGGTREASGLFTSRGSTEAARDNDAPRLCSQRWGRESDAFGGTGCAGGTPRKGAGRKHALPLLFPRHERAGDSWDQTPSVPSRRLGRRCLEGRDLLPRWIQTLSEVCFGLSTRQCVSAPRTRNSQHQNAPGSSLYRYPTARTSPHNPSRVTRAGKVSRTTSAPSGATPGWAQ